MRTRLRFRRTFVLAVAAALTVAGVGALPVAADETPSATFVVNASDDVVDGSCDATHCSLREAITAANATTAPDTISFDGVTSITPTAQLPVTQGRLTIDGGTEPACAGVPGVVLDGSLAGLADGLVLGGVGETFVRGLVFSRWGRSGVSVQSDDNAVQCSYSGTDVTGTLAKANERGIQIFGNGNLVGGSGAGEGNVLSGNQYQGLSVFGEENVAQGNFIGTDVTGTQDLGSGRFAGVALGGNKNTLGGTDAGARNVVSGNAQQGVFIPNETTEHVVEGNYIGVDVTGNVALGNAADGVMMGPSGTSNGHIIRGNVIGGNAGGVQLAGEESTANVIDDNVIGVGADGVTDVGNAGWGILVTSPDNTIRRNRIANNGTGVIVGLGAPVSGVTLLENSIAANDALGIDLNSSGDPEQGLTPNDPGDVDTDVQNFPVITGVDDSIVSGTLETEPLAPYWVELYASSTCDPSGYGEGARFIGRYELSTDAGGIAPFAVGVAPLADGERVTATATGLQPGGDTSEFSRCFPPDPEPEPPTIVPGGAFVTEGDDGTVELEVPVTLSAPSSATVSVEWATIDSLDQPQPEVDYVAESGTVTFLPGETSASASVTVLGDTLDEDQLWGAEWALLQFHSPTNGVVGGYSGLGFGLIVDDDPPVIRPVGGSVVEGDNGTVKLKVRIDLSTSSHSPVSIDWSTVNTTPQPQAGIDFASADGTLVFAPGQTTKMISITVYGDTVDEPGQLYGAEWGFVSLDAATGATFDSGYMARTAVALIVDDD